MSIPVDCPGCNAHYEAPDKFAGQRMKCKACGTVLTVPSVGLELLEDESPAPQPAATKPAARPTRVPQAPARPAPAAAPVPAAFTPRPLDDLLDDSISSQGKAIARPAGGKAKLGSSCPECGEPMNPEDIVCVECGYNIVKKKSMKSAEPKKKKKKKGSGGGAGPVRDMPDGLAQIFVVDIILCLLYYGMLSTILYMASQVSAGGLDPTSQMIFVYVVCMSIYAMVANGSMLAGKHWGWMLGYGLIALTLLNIVGGAFVQFAMPSGPGPGGGAYNAGRGIGFVVGLGIRLAILRWYYSGVETYQEWATGGKRKSSDSDY